MSAVTQIISPHWKWMTYGHFVAVNCCKCECWHLESHLAAVKIQFRQYVWLYTQSVLAERCWFSGFYYHWRCVFFGFFRLCTGRFWESSCLSLYLTVSLMLSLYPPMWIIHGLPPGVNFLCYSFNLLQGIHHSNSQPRLRQIPFLQCLKLRSKLCTELQLCDKKHIMMCEAWRGLNEIVWDACYWIL